MGSTAFEYHYGRGGVSLEQAFNEACADAAYEYGHGGYTGSLAEKDSVVQVQPTPVDIQTAQDLAEQLFRENDRRISDKWGPAGAIPIAQDAAEGTRTVTVTLRNPTLSHGHVQNTTIMSALPTSATRGKTVLAVRVVETPTIVYGTPEVSKGDQPLVTRYEVTGMRGVWDSIAAARKAATEAARTGALPPGFPAEIRGVVTRGNSPALLTVTPTVKKWTAKVEVVYAPKASQTSASLPNGGWYFFGWASS